MDSFDVFVNLLSPQNTHAAQIASYLSEHMKYSVQCTLECAQYHGERQDDEEGEEAASPSARTGKFVSDLLLKFTVRIVDENPSHIWVSTHDAGR